MGDPRLSFLEKAREDDQSVRETFKVLKTTFLSISLVLKKKKSTFNSSYFFFFFVFYFLHKDRDPRSPARSTSACAALYSRTGMDWRFFDVLTERAQILHGNSTSVAVRRALNDDVN